jgi:hypothetical protein
MEPEAKVQWKQIAGIACRAVALREGWTSIARCRGARRGEHLSFRIRWMTHLFNANGAIPRLALGNAPGLGQKRTPL